MIPETYDRIVITRERVLRRPTHTMYLNSVNLNKEGNTESVEIIETVKVNPHLPGTYQDVKDTFEKIVEFLKDEGDIMKVEVYYHGRYEANTSR